MTRKLPIIILIIIVSVFVFFSVRLIKKPHKGLEKENKIVTVGLKPSQQEYFSNQLSSATREVRLLDDGEVLIKQGKLEEATKYFEDLMKDNSFEAKGLAKEYLINAYEKKKDYRTAYQILYDDVVKNYKIPPEHRYRVPVEERLKYLKYASEGEYDLAVKHAQLSLETERKIPNRPKAVIKIVENRLNDLIAAKSYIESLKKK